jgi:acyl-CoA thioesterase-1
MKLIMALFISVAMPVGAKTVVFLGDSLTEGHQLSKEEAYPALVEKELKKDYPDLKVINGGVSGATSASGPKRLDWYLKVKPDILVLALGANDGLRGLKMSETEKNLSAVIEKAQKNGIEVAFVGMKMPTNYGEAYRKEFEGVFLKVAKRYKLKTLPFLLEGVASKPELNLPDGIHPNPKGHEIMAKTMIKFLRPLL